MIDNSLDAIHCDEYIETSNRVIDVRSSTLLIGVALKVLAMSYAFMKGDILSTLCLLKSKWVESS